MSPYRGYKEDECLAKLGGLLGCEFKSQGKYCPLDGIADTACCEIKQRNVFKDTFPTTIIGKNKIDYWKKHFPDIPLYFFVRFDDGDYYYRWNDADDITLDKGGLKHKPRDYYFVPKEFLVEF